MTRPACDESCTMCSGEWCSVHHGDPCACDVVERHDPPEQAQQEAAAPVTGVHPLADALTIEKDIKQLRRLLCELESYQDTYESDALALIRVLAVAHDYATMTALMSRIAADLHDLATEMCENPQSPETIPDQLRAIATAMSQGRSR